ncbi:MAG: hypothetical protein QF489_01265 [Planctomycetota bacterium]|jgi:hypothetical protein|nr:hypothetical protein [Planctomycetota bacterium]
MNDGLEPIADNEQQLAVPGTTQPGSLLRLRDVQALNRSFRRLAEVQEALLDRLEALEQEKQETTKLNGPLMALGGVALGLSIAVLAYVLWQNKDPMVIPPAATPEIVVQAPDVTVSAPENAEFAQALTDMNASIASVLEAQREDRQQLGELTTKLLLSEEEKNQLMREFALAEEQYQQDLAAADAAAKKAAIKNQETLYTPNDQDGAPTSVMATAEASFVQAFNGVLAADGYGSLRLQAGTLGADKASLDNVTWMSWGRDGLAETVIKAKQLSMEMHHMTRTMVLRFRDGDRVAQGVRTTLPAAGLRIDLESVNVAGWVKILPGLVDTSAVATAVNAEPVSNQPSTLQPIASPVRPNKGEPLNPKVVRKSLDDLISQRGSFSYYRLNSLGSVDGKLLKLVQINWHDNSGRLVKTIEADTLEVILHPGGSVELLLRNGAFLDGDVKSPFSADRFRLHLPSQDLNAWRTSGVPFVESDH